MLLSELADATGTSAASIKYYLREGLLPAGRRVTATRADYGERHVERLHLIRTLRETCATPIPHIAGLTALLDADPVPLSEFLKKQVGLSDREIIDYNINSLPPPQS